MAEQFTQCCMNCKFHDGVGRCRRHPPAAYSPAAQLVTAIANNLNLIRSVRDGGNSASLAHAIELASDVIQWEENAPMHPRVDDGDWCGEWAPGDFIVRGPNYP